MGCQSALRTLEQASLESLWHWHPPLSLIGFLLCLFVLGTRQESTLHRYREPRQPVSVAGLYRLCLPVRRSTGRFRCFPSVEYWLRVEVAPPRLRVFD